MPRINTDPTTFARRPSLGTRLLLRAGRSMMGRDTDNLGAMAHRPGVLVPWAMLETGAQRARSVLPEHLPSSSCSWSRAGSAARGASTSARAGGSSRGSTRRCSATRWPGATRRTRCSTRPTRAAFAYAEAVSADPVRRSTTTMVADLVGHFGEAGVVELTFWAALENMRGRFNSALGITSQGFSSGDACSLAMAGREDAQPASSSR